MVAGTFVVDISHSATQVTQCLCLCGQNIRVLNVPRVSFSIYECMEIGMTICLPFTKTPPATYSSSLKFWYGWDNLWSHGRLILSITTCSSRLFAVASAICFNVSSDTDRCFCIQSTCICTSCSVLLGPVLLSDALVSVCHYQVLSWCELKCQTVLLETRAEYAVAHL